MNEPHRHPVSATARRIARQVQSRLDGHALSGDAFVVSLYGEWGIGKTHCLKGIESFFDEQLARELPVMAAADAAKLVVPVFFDPWQFEHEEHLVVPLLKTIERKLDKVAADLEAARPTTVSGALVAGGKGVVQGVRAAGGVFRDVAVSLATGFKFKSGPLAQMVGFDLEFSAKDAIETARKAGEMRAAVKPSARHLGFLEPSKAQERLERRESLYFDVRSELEKLTQEGAQPELRLVVLIDDLDRCLPEKAVQVLESVKLFLNVQGFSFVLAVDDEVVERGIAHRYRPYLVAGDGAASTALPPITGAEYLEKVVHLPIHLQRWTEAEAADFLRQQYPALFAPSLTLPDEQVPDPTTPRAAPPPELSRDVGRASARGDASPALLQLVLRAVPLVPRKLIRLAEALEFQHQHFIDIQAADLWAPLHAARLVAVQQLYPALYRHLRIQANRYWRLFETRRDAAFGEPVNKDGHTLQQLAERYKARGRDHIADADGPPAVLVGDTETLREQLALLQLVDEASQQRGQPDPLRLFHPDDAPPQDRQPQGLREDMGQRAFADLYFHGVAPVRSPLRAPVRDPDLVGPVASIRDPDGVLRALLTADTLTRRQRLEDFALQGRLPDALFDALMAALQQNRQSALALCTQLDWLRDVAALTTPQQLLRLYQEHQVLDALLTEPPHAS